MAARRVQNKKYSIVFEYKKTKAISRFPLFAGEVGMTLRMFLPGRAVDFLSGGEGGGAK